MEKCPKCQKEFKNPVALRMHDMRVHSGVIRVPGQGQPKPRKKAPSWPKPSGDLPPSQDPVVQSIFEQIVREFTVGEQVKWANAFKAHPEWKEALSDIPVATQFYWGRVWKKRLADENENGPRPSALDEIYATVVREHVRDGMIQWREALRAHPEWEKGPLKGVGWPTRYSATATLKKRLEKQQAKTQASTAVATVEAPQALNVRPRLNIRSMLSSGVNTTDTGTHVVHCPKCGESIAMWNQVAQIIESLKHQQ